MNSPIISAAQLRQQIDSDTVVLDCRFSLSDTTLGIKQYLAGHIPGAYYFSLDHHLSGPVREHGGRHPLPNAELFAEELRAAGVNSDTRVVVYDSTKFGFAARAWWLIRYLGHQNVAVLDGGYQAWKSAYFPIDRRQPAARHGLFKPTIQKSWVLDAGDVRNRVADKSAILVDSREEKRYLGIEEPIDPIAGHIPGALNYPWQGVTDDYGYIKSEREQKARWKDLPANKEIVVYCGSGVTACVNLLSMAIAGRTAKLYPGSWSDWCTYEVLPKAVFAQKVVP